MAFLPSQSGMGVGTIGVGDPNVVFKRKFRWTLEVQGTNFFVPAYFVKIAARPNLDLEETEINFLNDKMWIPGKATWQDLTITYIDVAGTLTNTPGGTNANAGLYTWLTSVFDFTRPNRKFMQSKRSCYGAQVIIRLWDGCGNPLETWTLDGAWPKAIDFGELDYTSSDTVDIQLTLKYSQVSYQQQCPNNNFVAPDCSQCACS